MKRRTLLIALFLSLAWLFLVGLETVGARDELGMAFDLLDEEDAQDDEAALNEEILDIAFPEEPFVPERRTSLRSQPLQFDVIDTEDALFEETGFDSADAPHTRPPHSRPPHSHPPHHSRPPHPHPPHSRPPHPHPPHSHAVQPSDEDVIDSIAQMTEDIDNIQLDELMVNTVHFEEILQELALNKNLLTDLVSDAMTSQRDATKACWKDNEPRGSGVAPDRTTRTCPDTKPEKSMGLCYPKCGEKRTGLGPLCLDDCKAMKYKSEGIFFCCETPELCEKLIRTMSVKMPRTLAQFLTDIITRPEDLRKILADVKELLAIVRELRLPICSNVQKSSEIDANDAGEAQEFPEFHLKPFEENVAVEI